MITLLALEVLIGLCTVLGVWLAIVLKRKKRVTEIRIRRLDATDFEIRGTWTDTECEARLTIGCDPAYISLEKLIELVEMTRRAAEDRKAVIAEHGNDPER